MMTAPSRLGGGCDRELVPLSKEILHDTNGAVRVLRRGAVSSSSTEGVGTERVFTLLFGDYNLLDTHPGFI